MVSRPPALPCMIVAGSLHVPSRRGHWLWEHPGTQRISVCSTLFYQFTPETAPSFLSLLFLFSTISCALAMFILRPFDEIHLEMLHRSPSMILLILAGSQCDTYSMMLSAYIVQLSSSVRCSVDHSWIVQIIVVPVWFLVVLPSQLHSSPPPLHLRCLLLLK